MEKQTPSNLSQSHQNQPYYPYAQQLAYNIYDQSGIDIHGGWLHPKHILRVMRRKWLTILLVLIFCVVAAFFYLQKTTPIFRAESQIELSVRRPRILAQQAALIEDPGGAGSSEEIFNTRLERFRSRAVMQTALQRLLADHPDALKPLTHNGIERSPEQEAEARLRRLRNGIDITLLRRTRIVQIRFDHPDPVIAAAVCNAFAEAAKTSALEENRTSSDAAVVWLETQEEIQRESLKQAEEELLQHLATSGLDALESQRRTAEEALLGFNRALVEIQSEESRAQDLRATLDALELTPELAGNLPTGVPHEPEIRSILEEWRKAEVTRQQQLARFTENHPEIKAQDRIIELYREQAATLMSQARTAAKANEALLKQQAESLRRRKGEQSRLVQELDMKLAQARTERSALQRSHSAAEDAYRGILTRMQDARMAADENTATVEIIEPAMPPEKPIHPRSTIILALSIILGVGAGTGLALGVDHLEDHIVDPDDVAIWGVSLLAIIPHVKKVNRTSVALASLRDRFSQVTEAFAGLRAMLDSPQYHDEAQVVLIASSMPSEGKTVTSCNLAAAWAQKKRRVLIIDFDLRRPRLANIFGMPPRHPGLLSALSENDDLQTGENLAFQSSDCPTLDIIATRPVTGASPAELAGTKAVVNLLDWARKHYDHIVIDAPPLGIVSDSLALAPLADTVLVMVRPATSRKKVTQHTINRFQESGIKNIALIMNDVDFSKMGYGSYGSYYHYNKQYKTVTQDTEKS